MCFTCCANVRTPLNSPWVGAKLYLSSGMASAAGTTSCSTLLSDRSSTIAKVGFWSGLACMAACGLAATAVPTGPIASNRIPIATCLFIEKPPLYSLVDKAVAEVRLTILIHCEGVRVNFDRAQPEPAGCQHTHSQPNRGPGQGTANAHTFGNFAPECSAARKST